MIIQKAVKLAMNAFEQKMTDFANQTDSRALTADLALEFSGALKDAFSQAGRTACQAFIQSYDLQDTAIKNITNHIGDFVEKHADIITQAIQNCQQLPRETDVLVASMDGVNVLLREQGVQQGRPAQRPGHKVATSKNTAYKNAMTGAISCYSLPSEGQERPKRLQSCYVARMPQQGAAAFKQKFEQEVLDTEKKAAPGTTKIFLCDGHRSIWSYADNNPMYNDYEKLIDFYHTTEHLSKASEALFGKTSDSADAWYGKYRKKLLEDDDGAESVLHSMSYYSQNRKLPKSRMDELEQQKTFFRRNKDKMTYADFLARGLPIGSGLVEAACKSIVKTRLCRSGMRWSRQGGQYILHLRCFVKSNRWDVFWKQYIQLKRSA
jgi:hypothetical protein